MWIIDKFKDLINGNKVDIRNNKGTTKNSIEEIINYVEPDNKNIIDSNPVDKIKFDIKNYSKRLYELENFRSYSKELWEISNESSKPLMLMIMGEFKTGKSTFINAILEDEILKSDVTPATAVVSMISYGSKKKATAYFRTGESKEYSLEELADITAEGNDDKKTLRNNIKYVEVFLPKEILKRVTIIDTPGLNVDNELHIKATKDFMNKADLVFWVFAYGKAASKTEIAEIKELSERLKPIAIINRIDEIDEEEETLEEVIDEISKRLKSTVLDIIPVSSFLAKKAILEKEEDLLKESKWNYFLEKLDSEILEKSEDLKLKSIDKKLKEFSEELTIFIKKKKRDLLRLEEKCTNVDYKNLLLNKIDKLVYLIEKARKLEDGRPVQKLSIEKLANEKATKNEYEMLTLGIEFLEEVSKYLKDIDGTERIIESINSYNEIMTIYFEALDKLIDQWEDFAKQRKQSNREFENLKYELDEYNNSGFFGGTPIFDFDGKGSRLEKRRLEYNYNLELLNRKVENHMNNIKNKYSEIIRKELEIYNYLKQVKKPLIGEKEFLSRELINFDNTMEDDKKTLELLKLEIKKATKIALILG